MIDGLAHALTAVAAIGAGLNGGVFFAFSTFVMRALGRLPAIHGMSAMQAINREAPSPLFMTLLFGTGAVSIAAGVAALARWEEAWAPYVLGGSALYLVCPIATMTYHVPRNNALDRMDPDSPAAGEAWARWHPAWTAGNHVRTVACLASAVTFVLALRVT
jgi:uncharacterized membrane protein